MRVNLPITLSIALFGHALVAQANTGDLRATIEPGVGAMQPPTAARSWGWQLSGAVAVGLTDQLSIMALMEQARFPRVQPKVTAEIDGMGLSYAVDRVALRPRIELGLARIRLRLKAGIPPDPDLLPFLGLGLERIFLKRLVVGVGVRYFPLFDSALLEGPALATVHLQLGLILPFGDYWRSHS